MQNKIITLATLPEATAQEVFDQVARHLLTQNAKSMGRHCMYHSVEGLKCAAGCLISENEYLKGMENDSWQNLVDRKLAPSKHQELISELQQIHDTVEPNRWRGRLEVLSNKSWLNMPQI